MNFTRSTPVRQMVRMIMPALFLAQIAGCASGQQPSVAPGTQSPGPQETTATQGIRTLPATSWKILYNGRPASLAETLSASGYSAAIFQFAGVTCDTCQRDAQEYTRRIQASPLRGRIGHIVVFTDFPEDFQENDFQTFMMQNAPQSIRASDDHAKLWLSLQKNPSTPDRNVIVVLGQASKGLFLNEAAGRDMIFNALETLGAGGRGPQ